MRTIIAGALRLRVVILAAAIVLFFGGVNVLRRTPLDVFPEFARPIIEIQAEAPGLSAVEVESLITIPIEQALSGTTRLETMRSKSVLGLSSVVLLLERGADPLSVRQLVAERLALVAPRLPAVARAPTILPPLSSLSRVMLVGLRSESHSTTELSELAKWMVRPRLMSVRGVANVAIWGQRDRQIQVLVDPERLALWGVSLDEVERAAAAATAIGTGGFIDTPLQRLPVTQATAITSPADLAGAMVAQRAGAVLTLGDVAEVRIGNPAQIGDAVIGDGSGLLFVVEKQSWGNTLEVTRGIERELETLRPILSGVDVDTRIFRPAGYIEAALSNLGRALLIGCALVGLVLVAFLYDWRTAVISAAAIPLSVIAAGLMLRVLGESINTMVLAGLVIAVGEVVDDAIIDVENIARRLRLNGSVGSPRSAFQVCLDASVEVRSAVFVASVIVVLAFLPILMLGGVVGSFFRPLALAYVAAIVASLAVALLVTPALCLVILPKRNRMPATSPLVRGLDRVYRWSLPGFLSHPRGVALGLTAAIAFSGLAATRLGEEFLPDFQERDFLMHWVGKPGTSIEAMRRVTERASVELREIHGVHSFGAHIGRAEAADEVVGPEFAELWVGIDEDADLGATAARLREVVGGYPGLQCDVLTYLKERIKEVVTGSSATIVVRIFGPDLDELRETAREVESAIRGELPSAGGPIVAGVVEGVVDLRVDLQVHIPRLQVRARPDSAALHGLTAIAVQRTVETLVKGRKVGEVYDDQRICDVTIRGISEVRSDISSLRSVPIQTDGGGWVRLAEVAELEIESTPNVVRREGSSRFIDVTCNCSGRDLGSIARDIEHRVRSISFASGSYPVFLGEYAARQESRERILVFGALAILGILTVLHADFQSLRLVLLVALSIPFALVGGVAGAAAGGGVLSIGSLVGFVTVLGIAARNGILLVSHYRHLEIEEGMPFGLELVVRGARERLTPILMTALTASLALLPLTTTHEVAGTEIERPMAFVILGGLVSSTVLNLFVVPTLYLRLAGSRRGSP